MAVIINQNEGFGVNLSGLLGSDTFADNGQGTLNFVGINAPTLYVNGFAGNTNINSDTRYGFTWTLVSGPGAIATTNRQQFSGLSSSTTNSDAVWYAIGGDLWSGILRSTPNWTLKYIAPAGSISGVVTLVGPIGNKVEHWTLTANTVNTPSPTYSWVFSVNNSGASFISNTVNPAVTTSLNQIDVAGTVDTIQCTVSYTGGSILISYQLTW